MKNTVLGFIIFAGVLSSVDSEAAPKSLVHEVLIQSTAQSAWNAMTTAGGLKRCLKINDAVIEMKLMGKFHTNYAGTVGDENTIRNTILSFIPHRMYSFKIGFPKTFPGYEKIQDVVKADSLFTVVEFEDAGTEGIKARSTMSGYQDGESWDYVYKFFDRGNAYTLNALKTCLEE